MLLDHNHHHHHHRHQPRRPLPWFFACSPLHVSSGRVSSLRFPPRTCLVHFPHPPHSTSFFLLCTQTDTPTREKRTNLLPDDDPPESSNGGTKIAQIPARKRTSWPETFHRLSRRFRIAKSSAPNCYFPPRRKLMLISNQHTNFTTHDTTHLLLD